MNFLVVCHMRFCHQLFLPIKLIILGDFSQILKIQITLICEQSGLFLGFHHICKVSVLLLLSNVIG